MNQKSLATNPIYPIQNTIIDCQNEEIHVDGITEYELDHLDRALGVLVKHYETEGEFLHGSELYDKLKELANNQGFKMTPWLEGFYLSFTN